MSSREFETGHQYDLVMATGNKLEVRRVTHMSNFEDFADNEFLQKEAGWREELNQP